MLHRQVRSSTALVTVGVVTLLISPTILSEAGIALFALIGGRSLLAGTIARQREKQGR